jgi:hypothetical protein
MKTIKTISLLAGLITTLIVATCASRAGGGQDKFIDDKDIRVLHFEEMVYPPFAQITRLKTPFFGRSSDSID